MKMIAVAAFACGCVTVQPMMPYRGQIAEMLSTYCGGQKIKLKKVLCYEGEETKCTFRVKLNKKPWVRDEAIFKMGETTDQWTLINQPKFCPQNTLN